jgi:hypothetical protein
MKNLLLFVLASVMALPSFATVSPNLFTCHGTGMEISYGTTDFTGQPFISIDGNQHRFGERRDYKTWTRTTSADGSTMLSCRYHYPYWLANLEIVFPNIELDHPDETVRFKTRTKWYSDAAAPDPVELDCEASSVAYLASQVSEHEISIVQGEPDPTLEFTRRMVREKIVLPGEELIAHEQFSTTITYSILEHFDVRDTALVPVLDEDGTSTYEKLYSALTIAADKAPVVYTNIGPLADEFCRTMSQKIDTAFVVTAGSDSSELDSVQMPHCWSNNILIVGAWDQVNQERLSFSNWGEQVRYFAPSVGIDVVVPSGQHQRLTNGTVGSATVAAQLARLAKMDPALHGAHLIAEFLTKQFATRDSLSALPKGET